MDWRAPESTGRRGPNFLRFKDRWDLLARRPGRGIVAPENGHSARNDTAGSTFSARRNGRIAATTTTAASTDAADA